MAIPNTLSYNSGMYSIDTLVKIRIKQKGKDGKVFGVDVYKGVIGDMSRLGVIEPVKIKQQAISSATEASVQILRIDDMISSKGRGPAGGAGGMGGMPGGMGGMGGD
ncbi:Thermosome subunit alpha [uncultured archaeon]|nr:Thermosome subunit alpha [uncultured archaeon]